MTAVVEDNGSAQSGNKPAFREPTRDLLLTWGTYGQRYGFGLGLILTGLLVWAVLPTPLGLYFDYESPVGLAAPFVAPLIVAAGFVVLPAPLATRISAAALAGVPMLILTAIHELPNSPHSLYWRLSGTILMLLPVVALAVAWLLVRLRRGSAFLSLFALVPMLVVLGVNGILWTFDPLYLLPDPSAHEFVEPPVLMFVSFPKAMLVMPSAALVAWIAFAISRRIGARHDVMDIPGQATPAERQLFDPYAILALVFGVLGGWLGVVFGHIARARIKSSGDRGAELALVGLVFGYIGVVLTIVFLIYIAIAESYIYSF